MKRRTVAGLAVGVGTLCLFGSGSLVWFESGWSANSWLGFDSSVLIDFGGALFLVPAILWLEHRLTVSIENTQRSITERYLDSSSVNLLGPSSPWERVSFELARLAALCPTEGLSFTTPLSICNSSRTSLSVPKRRSQEVEFSCIMMPRDAFKISKCCFGNPLRGPSKAEVTRP
jgi:hypothetical protein